MGGADLTRIDCIDVKTALVVANKVGTNMSKFASDKHFALWLGLCPGTKITGGKVMSGRTGGWRDGWRGSCGRARGRGRRDHHGRRLGGLR